MARNSAVIVFCLMVLSACASRSQGPYNRGVEQYGIGHVDRCIEDYRQAIELHPADPRPKFNLAVVYQDQGELEKAEGLYREIVTADPGFAPAWSNLASIMEKRGLTDEAQKLHLLAMKADGGGCASACSVRFFSLKTGTKRGSREGLRKVA